MAEQKIEFRKIRDFGENFSDTFLFLKQNLKQLLGPFFAICGIFMLGQAVFNSFYQSHAFGFLDQIKRGGTIPDSDPFSGIFSVEYMLTLVFTWLAFVSMKVVVAVYVKYYIDHNGEKPKLEDVWKLFRRYFFRIFIYSIPMVLLMIIGLVLCVIPGVYLIVVLTPFELVLIMEEDGFSGAINRCFNLIKDNFWISFGIYIVAYLVYSVSSTVIGAIVSILTGLVTWFSTDSLSTTFGIATSVLNVFSFVFYIIYLVSVAFHYFTLVEQRDGTGMLNRIEGIGAGPDQHPNIEEQY